MTATNRDLSHGLVLAWSRLAVADVAAGNVASWLHYLCDLGYIG